MSDDKKPEFSPTLKMCADDIKTVLERYDVAAVVILQDVTHTEFFLKIDPPHSLARMEHTVLRLDKAPPNVEQPDKFHPKVVTTVNMFANLQAVCGQVMRSMVQSLLYAQKFYKMLPPSGPPRINGAYKPKGQ